MDQPRDVPSIISSTTYKSLKRKVDDCELHSLSALQEDVKRTLAAHPSFLHRRGDMDKHLMGRILMESQLPAQHLHPATQLSNNPSIKPALLLGTVFNDPEPPPKEYVSQPIETFDSEFYPDDPSPSLGPSNVIHVDEEYINPIGPAWMEKSMMEDDPEFIDEPEEEATTLTLGPWLKEDSITPRGPVGIEKSTLGEEPEEEEVTTPTLGPTLSLNEDGVSPRGPVGIGKSMREDDPMDEPDGEEATMPTLSPILSSKEDESSQETMTTRCSSLPPEKNLAPSSSVLNTFFPNLSKPKLARSMKKRGYYSNDSGGQWVNWPTESELKKMPSGSRKEALIAKKLTTFINAVIQLVQGRTPEVRGRIYALDGQEKRVYNRDGTYLKPDIFICGTGSCFSSTSNVSDVSNPKALRHWRYCIYPIEVKTTSQRTREHKQVIAQMGTYVREVFAAQPNCRFVPSLIFTEKTVEFLFWDRSGVIISEKMDYHKHPVSFCKLLGDLVEWTDEERGFDPYLSVKDGAWTLQPSDKHEKESTVLIAKFFHPYTVFGKNVICWKGLHVVQDHGGEIKGKHVLIQDAWLPAENISFLENFLNESKSILKDAPGLIQIERIEHVVKLDKQTFDSVQANRKNVQFTKGSTLSRIRIISACHKLCLPVDRIKHSDELLYALKDIVEGLQCLYEEHKYIQRSIKPWTILMQPEAPEGQRGIMLSLYSLERILDNREPMQSQNGEDAGVKSIFFNSQDIWKRLPFTISHRHLDGVLSCYYILCFFAGNFRRPNGDSTGEILVIPELLTWERGSDKEVMGSKLGYFSGLNFFKAQPGWDVSINNTLYSLHHFFHKKLRDLAALLLEAETPKEYAELVNGIMKQPQLVLQKALIKQDLDLIMKCWQ